MLAQLGISKACVVNLLRPEIRTGFVLFKYYSQKRIIYISSQVAVGVPKCFELQPPHLYTQLHLKPSDIHSSLHSYVLCTGILFLRSHFHLWLHWTYHIPSSPGVLMLQTSHLQLSYEDLRLKQDILIIELSIMTLRNAWNWGQKSASTLAIPERREMATQYSSTKALPQLSPDTTILVSSFGWTSTPVPPFCSWRIDLTRTLLEVTSISWSWRSHVANWQSKWLGNWLKSRNGGLCGGMKLFISVLTWTSNL